MQIFIFPSLNSFVVVVQSDKCSWLDSASCVKANVDGRSFGRAANRMSLKGFLVREINTLSEFVLYFSLRESAKVLSCVSSVAYARSVHSTELLSSFRCQESTTFAG